MTSNLNHAVVDLEVHVKLKRNLTHVNVSILPGQDHAA